MWVRTGDGATDILASTLPYCIGFHQIYIHVVQLVHLTKDEVIPVINGSIVGLCQANITSNQGGSTSEGTSDTPHILPGETPILPCHGLGIVRSVDVIQKLIYLISPIRLTTLKRINLLIRGRESKFEFSLNQCSMDQTHCSFSLFFFSNMCE